MAKLNPPIEHFNWLTSISQLFGVNATFYQANFSSIPAHNGIDIVGDSNGQKGYGTKILSAHTNTATCSKVSTDFPTKTHGTGVYLTERLQDGTYLETVYWHLADIHVKAGDVVEPQQPIGSALPNKVVGLMGNTGMVSPKPTREDPYAGTHLHFGVQRYDSNGVLIQNDYHGYCDPTPLLYRAGDRLPIQFSRNLTIGSSGAEVAWLQTILNIEGFAKDYEPNGYFGPKTLRDVMALQLAYGINPPIGYIGPKTRGFLNSLYARM